jgi:hypothetical protein
MMRQIINGFNPRSRMGSDFLKNQYNNEIRKFTSRDNDNLTMEKGIPDSCHEQTPCSLPNCSRQIVTSLKIAYFTDFTSSMDMVFGTEGINNKMRFHINLGIRTNAILFSMTVSCKRHDIDQRAKND